MFDRELVLPEYIAELEYATLVLSLFFLLWDQKTSFGFHRSRRGGGEVGRIKFCSIIVTRLDKPRFKVDSLLSVLSEPDKTFVEASEKLSAHCSEIWMMLLLCTCQ